MAVVDNPKIYFWAHLFGSVSFIAPVTSLFYLHRGLVYSDFFIMLIGIVVSMFVFEVPTGAFADRYGHKASFIVGELIKVLTTILFIFAFNPYVFYTAAVLIGLAITFYSGADETFIYESLKETKQEKKMSSVWSKTISGGHIAALITTVIGAVIAKDLLEWQFVVLLVSGLVFQMIKIIFLTHLTPPNHLQKLHKKSPFYHIKQGLTVLKKKPFLISILMSETLVLIPLHVFNFFDQVFFVNVGLAVALIGVVYAVNSILSFFVQQNLEYFENKLSRKTIVMGTGVATFLAFLAASLTKNIFLALAVFFVLKLCNQMRYPVISQIKNEHIPSGSRATTLSLLSMIDSFFDVIVFTSLGFISNNGLNYVFLGSALVVFIGLLFPVRLKSR
ncbi:MFS transporter [Candidatus Woesearchaeota archaeon]|nr:MFS transporter [Candidatus Woesearchaeota archaeon]